MKSGGITQLKFHLAHLDPKNKAKKCPGVPHEVKREIQAMLHQKTKQKQRKLSILKRFMLNCVA